MGDYVESQGEYSTFIDDNYVNPMDVTLSFPEKKRNLIYIFLESMETTFADEENGGAFEENVIQELTALAQENEDFRGRVRKSTEDTPCRGPAGRWVRCSLRHPVFH